MSELPLTFTVDTAVSKIQASSGLVRQKKNMSKSKSLTRHGLRTAKQQQTSNDDLLLAGSLIGKLDPIS